jgi:hypothetical protein
MGSELESAQSSELGGVQLSVLWSVHENILGAYLGVCDEVRLEAWSKCAVYSVMYNLEHIYLPVYHSYLVNALVHRTS